MEDYPLALFIDVSTVVLCAGLLFRFGDLRLSHPAIPYFVFHIHTVTTRLAGLLNGAPTLYTTSYWSFAPVRPDEVIRATLYADIAFWLVTLVWIGVKLWRPPQMAERSVLLDPRLLRPILVVAFCAGLIGFRYGAKVPGIDYYEGDASSAWSSSSYLYILPQWVGLALLGYVYQYGFRRWAVGLLAIYLALMALQSAGRFRFIIGFLLAVQIWIEQQDRRWPSRRILLGLLALALFFFPMKRLAYLIQYGGTLDEVSMTFTDSVAETAGGMSGDQMFLDQYASGLTLLDAQGKKYWGSIYLPLLTLPIPRAIWPDKPALGGFMQDISSWQRPMAVSGMIVTYMGEAYANFGLAGIFLVPPALALFLGLFYRAAYQSPRESVVRFSYILLSVNLIQVYRDGLVSLVVFTFVNMMPLMIIVVVHLGAALARRRGQMDIPQLPQAQ